MLFYIVASVAWACPGGWFSGLVPPTLHPLICQAKSKTEIFSDLSVAKKRVHSLGMQSQLIVCKALRCQDIPTEWIIEPVFAQ